MRTLDIHQYEDARYMRAAQEGGRSRLRPAGGFAYTCMRQVTIHLPYAQLRKVGAVDSVVLQHAAGGCTPADPPAVACGIRLLICGTHICVGASWQQATTYAAAGYTYV